MASKAIELIGAILLVVPLYKATAVQWAYLSLRDQHVRKVLEEMRSKPLVPWSPIDTVQLAAAMLEQRPIIRAGRFTRVEMVIVVVGGLLLVLGGGMEVLERLHLDGQICSFIARQLH